MDSTVGSDGFSPHDGTSDRQLGDHTAGMIKSELSGATLLVDLMPKRLCSNSVYLSSNQTH